MNEKCKTCRYAYRYKGEATFCLLYNQLKDNCADYEEIKSSLTAVRKSCANCHYGYKYPDERIKIVCNNTKLSPDVMRGANDVCSEYSPAIPLKECSEQATPKLSAAREAEEKCCGACAFMIGESPYGDGTCAKIFAETVYCGDQCHGDHFVSKEDMERAVEVLEAHNKWRRDDNVPNSQPMQDPKELGKAIDLAILFCKTFMDL